MGEQALNTHLGGPEFMRGQLHRLLDAMDLPGLPLGIIQARAPPRSLSWRRILDLRRPQGRDRGIPRG
ncbi:Scr1 family TA system antitoxin-like transcriptional regulator [Streptomyces luteogriseus]|uniref:Scr1 family TA system antitoxin-like transcriptional regulator n=1 Tax=Streptomyces luteogriseus TaxID=68233 RepID=UPI0036EC4007